MPRLLRDQGYTTTGARFEHASGWPSVVCSDHTVTVTREGPWQWLMGHLVVSAILACQPEFMCFHAGAVAIGSHGVLLMGDQGSGKTSVTLALAARGHGFLSDEVGALQLATGELVPVRRSALVRPGPGPTTAIGSQDLADFTPDGHRRLCVPVSQAFPAATGRSVPLRSVIRLRRFSPTTRLERLKLRPGHLGALTPMTCSMGELGAGTRILRLLGLLGGVSCYALDAASPEAAAELIERTVGV